jgi:hypothetical protein
VTAAAVAAAAVAAAAAVTLPAAGAQAQWYSSVSRQPAALYPYDVQKPYAIEVAPNTYVIRRPSPVRARPDTDCSGGCGHIRHVTPAAPALDKPHKPNDRALLEELRKRHRVKTEVINTTKIVREAPVVIEHKRYVDDPPHIIERRHFVDDDTAPQAVPAPQPAPAPRHRKEVVVDDGKGRVIFADAEVTIIGPDRMTIKLSRKSRAGKAKASAD